MRAEILAEPQADFDRWLQEKTLGAGADLVQKVHVTADEDSFEAEGASTVGGVEDVITIVAGSRIILEVQNEGSEDLQLNLSTTALGTVPAGETALLSFDTAENVPGDRTIVGLPGGDLVFRAIEAEVETIDLGAFELVPDHLELEAGKTYLFQVENVHNAAHNVFIGDRGSETLAFSATISGGATTSFTWTAEAGEFDMWCDVPGHADAGMIGTVSVS
jgi:uncharacterized cupredoxin-like copper-binding protein